MSKLDKYLEEIQMPDGYEPKKGDTMFCKICKRKVHLLNNGSGTLVCCGEAMVKATMGVNEAEGMHGLPKGWTQGSLKKFSKSLTGKEGTKKGFFDKCVEKMRGKIKNPERFCASVKDELHGSTYWRGKGKSPQEAGKDVKKHQNVEKG